MLFNCSRTIFILFCLLTVTVTVHPSSSLAITETDHHHSADTDIPHSRQLRSLVSKGQLLQTSSFFQLFNIPYIICFFAAKGKWPFIPAFLQSSVHQASRSLFAQNDEYIKHYCKQWITIIECHRPPPEPTEAPTTTPEPETEEPVTECVCGRRSSLISHVPSLANSELVFMDKTFVGNVSAETIQTTIEFLNSLLPITTSSSGKRRKPKGRDRLNVSPREN